MNAFVKVLASAALLSLVGCAKDETRPAEESPPADSTATTPYSEPSAGSTEATPTASMPNVRVVYFGFDSSEISGQGQRLVEGWAAYLSANPNAKVRLEGHCDERGTREYNVALGERRANALRQALAARGVSERQITVSSFGEERAVSEGHDEAAWQQNRRVEIAQ